MNDTPTSVRILHLDDNPADAQLIRVLIDEANHEFSASVESVSTKEAYLAALRSCSFDVILSDYRMNGYDGNEALKDARAICPHIPFIMVTGELGEERAIETLKAGATDYVLKDRIKRLVPSIKRALKDAALEQERHENELLLAKTHQELSAIVDGIVEGLTVFDMQGNILRRNERAPAILGYGSRGEDVRAVSDFDKIFEVFYLDGRPLPADEWPISRLLRGENVKDFLAKFRRRDTGLTMTLSYNGSLIRDEAGTPLYAVLTYRDVTERTQVEEALRESKQRYSALFANKLNGMAHCKIITDEQGRPVDYWIMQVNEAYEQIIGIKKADIEGRRVTEVFPDIKTYAFDYIGVYGKVALEGGEIKFEEYFEATGQYLSIYAYSPLPGEFAAIFTDVTERKRAGAKLAESEERYRDLFEKMSEGFLLVEPIYTEAGAPVSYYYRDANPALEQLTHLKRTEIIGKTAHEVLGVVEPHWVECFARVAKSGKSERIEEHSEALGGWYSVYVYCPTPGMAALIYTNVTEQRKTAEALAASERKYRELLETANSIILRWDNQGIIRFINDYGLRFFGYTREELLGRDVMTIAPKVETSTGRNLESLVNDILQHPERYTDHTNENIRKDGTTVWVVWTNKVILDEQGKVREVLAIGNDITALKEAEGGLAEAYNQIQSIIDNTPAIVYAFDLEERFVLANTALAELLNSTPDAVLGKRRHELMPKEDADWHEANDRQVIEAGKAMEFEEYSALQGRTITWLTTKFPLRDARGKIYAVAGISADISERKRAEEALKESEARFHALADNIPQLAWMTDETGWRFWYNQRWYEYTGTTFEEVKGWGWQKVHHPDHVERVTESVRRAVSEGQSWEDTFPIRSKTGEYRWFLSRAFAIKDEQGKVKRWFGTNTDITDQRQAAEALKASEENLRLMVNHATEAMIVVDTGGVIEAVSDLGSTLLGYQERELLGHKVTEFAEILSRLETLLALENLRKNAPRPVTLSMRIRTKSAGMQWMSVTASFINAGTNIEKYFVRFQKLELPLRNGGPVEQRHDAKDGA